MYILCLWETEKSKWQEQETHLSLVAQHKQQFNGTAHTQLNGTAHAQFNGTAHTQSSVRPTASAYK